MAHTYSEQDHETFWGDNEDMKEKTRAYAKRAAIIADEIPLLTNHPWKEDAHHNPWKLRILDLERECRGESCDNEAEKTRDLLLQLENARKEGQVGERSRHLILLEDLSPRVAELLGVLLDIPPEFFLSHFEGNTELHVRDRQLFKRGSSKYWKVAVPQIRSLPQSRVTERGAFWLSCGSVDRAVGIFDDRSRIIAFHSYVSYWSNSYGNGSWIAVIMVDPQQSYISSSPTSNPNDPKIIHLKNSEQSNNISSREVVLNSAKDEFAQPHERSIFNTAAKAYDNAPPIFTDDPFSATYIVRNCIRAEWEQQVWWAKSKISRMICRELGAFGTRPELLASEDFKNERVTDKQAVDKYQFLMELQREMRAYRHEIRTTLYKFRLRDIYHLQEKPSELENYMKEEETKSWRFLGERLQYVEEFLNDHMKMYSARSAMEETYEARMQTAVLNRMARSSGKLTKLAAIIVPCTFVASIFSMRGDFAAGESLFYVYWIVSIPITVVLLSWIRNKNPRKTKLSEKSKV